MYNYTQDRDISTFKGKILQNNYYLRKEIEPLIHSQEVVRSIFGALNEPLLYNYYLDIDIYRWLYVPTWGIPFSISICRKEFRYWITIKKCVRRYSPVLASHFCLYFYDKSNSYYRNISEADWFTLEKDFSHSILENAQSNNIIIDGAVNYIEMHIKNGYGGSKITEHTKLFDNLLKFCNFEINL